MKRTVQGRWRQKKLSSLQRYACKTTPADSILSLTNMALFRFRLVKSLRIAAGMLEICMTVPKVVQGGSLNN